MGPTMQSQQRPSEVSTMELVTQDYPEDSMLTAGDSRQKQPPGQ